MTFDAKYTPITGTQGMQIASVSGEQELLTTILLDGMPPGADAALIQGRDGGDTQFRLNADATGLGTETLLVGINLPVWLTNRAQIDACVLGGTGTSGGRYVVQFFTGSQGSST